MDSVIHLLNNWARVVKRQQYGISVPGVILWRIQWWHCRMFAVFSGYQRDRDFVLPVLFFSLNCNILRYMVIPAGGEDNLVF